MKKKIYFEFIYLLVLGGLSSLSLPPYNFLFINLFTFSLFFIFIFKKKKNKNLNSSFLYGWFFGLGYFLTNIYWITISLTFDINFKFLIPIALIFIPSLLAIFYGLSTFLFFLINLKNPISNFFLLSILIGATEYLRGNILSGFPWNLIAYSFSENLEIIQILSIIGTYAFNVLCISFFMSPAIFILRESKKEIIVCIFFLLLPIALFISGSLKIKSFQELEVIKNNYTIRAIGSKVDLDRFYNNIDTISVIDELIELSEPDLDSKILFIWPEGIIPSSNQLELQKFAFLFDNRFNDNHFLGIGINSLENKNGINRIYNSFSFYSHRLDLVDDYKKVKLVPFGEFLPFEKLLGSIGLKTLTNNYQSFTSGKKREIISINNDDLNVKILPLICYEIIYSGKIFKNHDFDYIINISEDGWFGNSIGPHQHFAHNIYRSIESGKYLIRSANNGITAIINPTGFVEKMISIGKSGFIDFSEKRVSNTTLFSQHGNKMFLILIFLYIFLIFSFNRNSK